MTPAQVKDVGTELIHLLSQQRLLYLQLHELAKKQRTLVDGSNPEMLLRVLASRQRLIDRLTSINQKLKPIREDWQQISQTLPPAQRNEAQQLVAGVQEILGEIISHDEEDTKAMQAQQQKVSTEIRNTSAGKRVNQAYSQHGLSAQSRYFDTHNT